VPRSATIERTPTRVPSPPGPSGRSRRSLRGPAGSTLFGLAFALAFFVLELRPLLDNSFLWHLKTGHWILDHHRIPGHDLFSFTAPGEPWVVQSWLAEVLYAAVDRVLGSFGLRLLRAGTAAAIAFLVYKLAARLVGDRVRGALITLATLGMAVVMWAERPLLFGVLAMVVLVWTLEVPESRVGRHALVVIPPIMWIWANMHGSFAVGFGYLVLHLAGRALDGHRPTSGRERVLLLATLVAAVACLANPLGLSLLTFPIHLLSRGDTLAHIREWQSPDFHSAAGMLFAVWLAITVAALFRGRERATRRDVLIAVAFLVLSLWATRNLVLTPIVMLPILARALAIDPDRRVDDRHLPRHWLAVGLLVVLGWTGAAQAASTAGYDFSDYPVKAMEVVDQQGLLGRHLFTTDEWAAYVIDQYWPRQPVFIDDRYDMYPTALAEDYFTVTQVKPGWQDVLDRHQIDVIVWRTGRPITQLLDLAPAWQQVYRDKLSTVWVRRDATAGARP
jgi:hypothetical protein